MTAVTIHEAKTNLSKLIQLIEQGQEIIIKRSKTPVAKLSAYNPTAPNRKPGGYKNMITESVDAWDDKTDKSISELFHA